MGDSDTIRTRGAVFVHFDPGGVIDDYVLYYLRALRPFCTRLVFVTTSGAGALEMGKVEGLCDLAVSRENVGYDFMSYRLGLAALDLGAFDEVLICNDSVYGPLFPLGECFDRMNGTQCDFWGMTESHDIAPHVQSYFMAFRRPVLGSEAFRGFWDRMEVLNDKREIIERYEVGLSRALLEGGFRHAVYCGYAPGILNFLMFRVKRSLRKRAIDAVRDIVRYKRSKMDVKSLNVTHFFWRDLILKRRLPLLKVELLRDNPMKLDVSGVREVIARSTSYDYALIERHLDRVRRAPGARP